jgi:hypothetical protein
VNRIARVLALAGSLFVLSAGPALASHQHVMQVGNGQCVILAANGGEDAVELPLAVFQHNPNVDIAPGPGKLHPLHVLVHQGVPGEHNRIAVAGTAAAAALCSAGIVND